MPARNHKTPSSHRPSQVSAFQTPAIKQDSQGCSQDKTVTFRRAPVDDRPPYQYEPLNATHREIRILCVDIERSKALKKIVGRLEHTSLRAKRVRRYKTISWCWGTDPGRETVIVDGEFLSVRATAVNVLWSLCVQHGHAQVWLDAVCINQGDIAERGQQVGMMGSV